MLYTLGGVLHVQRTPRHSCTTSCTKWTSFW